MSVLLSEKQWEIICSALRVGKKYIPVELHYQDGCGKENDHSILRRALIMTERVHVRKKSKGTL